MGSVQDFISDNVKQSDMPTIFCRSCVCNSRYQIHGGHGGSDRRMVIRAQQNIKEGQEITTRQVVP